jgi:hypothetical protein
MQLYAESSGYRVSIEMGKLLKKIPFVCSMKYYNMVYKNNEMIERVVRGINMAEVKRLLVKREGRKNSNDLMLMK